jgi:hypothetical protein
MSSKTETLDDVMRWWALAPEGKRLRFFANLSELLSADERVKLLEHLTGTKWPDWPAVGGRQ